MSYAKEVLALHAAIRSLQETVEDLHIQVRKKLAISEEYMALIAEHELKLKRLRAKGPMPDAVRGDTGPHPMTARQDRQPLPRRCRACASVIEESRPNSVLCRVCDGIDKEQRVNAKYADGWNRCLGARIVADAKGTSADKPFKRPIAYERWISGMDYHEPEDPKHLRDL